MRARTWIMRSLSSAAALVVLASGAIAQAPPAPNKAAAVVDGAPITMAEVDAILKQAGPTPTPLTEVQRRQRQMEALEALIDDLLLQNFLRTNGPPIALSEVEKKRAELAEALKKEGKTLQDYYKESGQNDAQLRTNIVSMLQWLAYVKEHVTEADTKQYYVENKDFFDRVMVRASHIVMRVSPSAPDSERQAVRAKLQALRQDILSNKIDFAEAAKKHSQCTSAPGGGDIGFFSRKLEVEEAFGKAAFALQVGDISDIVETDYGMHLIKVTARKPGQPSDYAKIKEEVRELYIEEMRLALLAQQRKVAHIEINLP